MLNNERNLRLVLTLTYHPLLRDLQKVLNEAQILLTSKKEHKTIFGEKPPMIGWRKARTLKDYLVRATKNLKVPDVMVNVPRFAGILRTHVSLKTLMGISTIFLKEFATQILLFLNFTVALVQQHFHQHFKLPEHNGMDNWRVT